MKKLILFSLFVGLFLTQAAIGQANLVINTPHGFDDATWNTTDQVCITCHTPHDGTNSAGEVLWSHELSLATYTVYSSPTLDAGAPAGTLGDPSGNSKLCLSCHDGTVALNNFVGNGSPADEFAAAYGVDVSNDLSNDHPISFTYDAALVTADQTTNGGVVGLNDPTANPISGMLFGGEMQCASCHDPHNNLNGNFLVMSNSGSALCYTCHIK